MVKYYQGGPCGRVGSEVGKVGKMWQIGQRLIG